MSGATLLLTILLLDETRTAEKRSARQAAPPDIPVARLLANPPIRLILALAFVIALYVATLFSSFSVYAERVLFADQPTEIVVQNVNLIIMLLGLAYRH